MCISLGSFVTLPLLSICCSSGAASHAHCPHTTMTILAAWGHFECTKYLKVGAWTRFKNLMCIHVPLPAKPASLPEAFQEKNHLINQLIHLYYSTIFFQTS